MTDPLWQYSAGMLAQLIRKKDVSSTQVVQSHLDRIEAVNDKLNAVTVVLAESALKAAARADNGDAMGPLHGVPFTIKENIDCVGSPTTQGVPMMAEAMPSVDSPVVERMKAAGAIPIGRTNLPEMGLRITTDNPLRGRTQNPWSQEHTAGGSSGGEGSAIASGMSPMGLGNDIGGSVRNPAYCCGITSLKPTIGRIPHATCIPPSDLGLAGQLMAVEGPMARTVSDLRTAYEILSGRHPRDPVSVDAPLYGKPPAIRKAALVTDIPGVTLPAHHVNAIEAAGDAMAAAGWQVEHAVLPELELITEIWTRILADEFRPSLELFSQFMSAPAVKLIATLCDTFTDDMSLAETHQHRWRLSCAWSEFFEEFPVIIGPTWTNDPFLHNADIAPGGTDLTLDYLRFITPASLLGLPASAVPTGTHDGLPTGVQVIADKWREDIVLDVAGIIENKSGLITPIDPRF